MLRLAGLVVSIALADSLNPSTVGPALYLAAAERPRREVLRFTGTVAANGSTYPAAAGLSGPDAALLKRQGAHLDVETTNIQVEPHK